MDEEGKELRKVARTRQRHAELRSSANDSRKKNSSFRNEILKDHEKARKLTNFLIFVDVSAMESDPRGTACHKCIARDSRSHAKNRANY